MHAYSCLQFGPFHRHRRLREDITPTVHQPDVRTSMKTVASNTTTKTETKDTNDVTMDDFWDFCTTTTT